MHTRVLLVALGALLVAGVTAWVGTNVAAQESGRAAEIAKLRAELDQLRGRLPDQSHVMKDVGYHFANLWFAARARNWSLAKFYTDETRSHLRWAVRVIPVRRTSSGELDLRVILDGLERTVFADLQKAVEQQDARGFPDLYRRGLVGCYSCHQAAEKPYLRPRIPDQPEAGILDFDPSSTGPQPLSPNHVRHIRP
jgi:hypothetical protein